MIQLKKSILLSFIISVSSINFIFAMRYDTRIQNSSNKRKRDDQEIDIYNSQKSKKLRRKLIGPEIDLKVRELYNLPYEEIDKWQDLKKLNNLAGLVIAYQTNINSNEKISDFFYNIKYAIISPHTMICKRCKDPGKLIRFFYDIGESKLDFVCCAYKFDSPQTNNNINNTPRKYIKIRLITLYEAQNLIKLVKDLKLVVGSSTQKVTLDRLSKIQVNNLISEDRKKYIKKYLHDNLFAKNKSQRTLPAVRVIYIGWYKYNNIKTENMSPFKILPKSILKIIIDYILDSEANKEEYLSLKLKYK